MTWTELPFGKYVGLTLPQVLAPWCDEIQVVADLSHIDDTSAEMLFAR